MDNALLSRWSCRAAGAAVARRGGPGVSAVWTVRDSPPAFALFRRDLRLSSTRTEPYDRRSMSLSSAICRLSALTALPGNLSLPAPSATPGTTLLRFVPTDSLSVSCCAISVTRGALQSFLANTCRLPFARRSRQRRVAATEKANRFLESFWVSAPNRSAMTSGDAVVLAYAPVRPASRSRSRTAPGPRAAAKTLAALVIAQPATRKR